MVKPPRPPVIMLVATAAVAILAVLKYTSDDFRRPLGEDELITLRVYTGAGTNGDGTPRELNRREQLERLAPLSPSDLAIGMYTSLGRWTEPNNHVVHSALVNLFLGRVHPIEAAVRLPALLAACGFALALARLCIVCARPWGAPAAAALAMVCPYVSWYSAESRGYALMMLLLVFSVLAARWLLARPASVLACASFAAVSVLTVVNQVNLSADWIAPAFAVLFAAPRWVRSDIADRAAIRKSLFAVCLAVAAILGVFFLDRLPHLVSAMKQYGVPYSGAGGYAEQWVEVLNYLFPTILWKVIGLVGLVGAIVAACYRETRGVVLLGAAALVASAVHFAAAGKFPYLRNCGYLLIPLLFGCGVLGDRAVQVLHRNPLRWLLATGFAAGAVGLAWIDPPANPDPDYSAFARQLADTAVDGTPGRVILERRVTKSLDLYFPAGWDTVETEFPTSGRIDLIRIEKVGDDYSIRKERYRIADAGPATFVVWHPPFAVTAVNPEPLLAELKREGATTIQPFHARYQAKLSVFSRVTVILAEGADEAPVRRAAQKYGGAVKVLRRE